jgi:TolA-binding protein
MKAMSQQDVNFNGVFKQLTEILERSLTRINEVEQHISKDLESIRRQLDAVGVLKDNIANLNNRIDSLSKKLTELSKSEPQELNRMMMRSISELDKRMQMFTVTEVLSRIESGQGFAPRTIATSSAPKDPKTTPKASSKPAPAAPTAPASPEPAAPASPGVDAVAEPTGSDQPWREKMREKYGLKKKPGKV